MRYGCVVAAEFEAAHFLEGDPRCGIRPHGHRYRIEANVGGKMRADPKVRPVDLEALLRQWQAIAGEFNGRSVQDMMPGVITDPFGIARYLLERMLQDWPYIQSVSVWEHPDLGATVIVGEET
jgi:6-pyruvoyl-tetrahydropterin synthase